MKQLKPQDMIAKLFKNKTQIILIQNTQAEKQTREKAQWKNTEHFWIITSDHMFDKMTHSD